MFEFCSKWHQVCFYFTTHLCQNKRTNADKEGHVVRVELLHPMLLGHREPKSDPDADVESHVDGKARIRRTQKRGF